jgi:hypothetical protein
MSSSSPPQRPHPRRNVIPTPSPSPPMTTHPRLPPSCTPAPKLEWARLRTHRRRTGSSRPRYDPAIRGPPLHVDVRDVARAHVLALKFPPSDAPKRFILSSSTFTWKEAIEFVSRAAESREAGAEGTPAHHHGQRACGPAVRHKSFTGHAYAIEHRYLCPAPRHRPRAYTPFLSSLTKPNPSPCCLGLSLPPPVLYVRAPLVTCRTLSGVVTPMGPFLSSRSSNPANLDSAGRGPRGTRAYTHAYIHAHAHAHHSRRLPRKHRPRQLGLPQARVVRHPPGPADDQHPHQAGLDECGITRSPSRSPLSLTPPSHSPHPRCGTLCPDAGICPCIGLRTVP